MISKDDIISSFKHTIIKDNFYISYDDEIINLGYKLILIGNEILKIIGDLCSELNNHEHSLDNKDFVEEEENQ